MAPAVEAAAIAHLDDPDPQVVIGAAETLGRYGSPASAQPLRMQFERWHRTWEGQQQALRFSLAGSRPDSMHGVVELAFLQALGQGQAWLTPAPEPRELRALCVTDNCRQHADQMISAAGEIRINIMRIDDPENSIVGLAQYQMTSIAALEHKLAQYPRETGLTLDLDSLDPEVARATAAALRQFAEAHGLTIRR
ncbi:MAG: hypothetical protein ABI818_13385 [Acidobacteriota bacterium]